jgi:hypothetical protein
MTYTEAKRAANLALSFSITSKKHIQHWNALDDALNDLPFDDFARIHAQARAGNTEADFAIVCICE